MSKERREKRDRGDREPTKRRLAAQEEIKVENVRAQYLQRDLDLNNFDIKTRQNMRDLLEPVLFKGKEDRDLILNLEAVDVKILERLDLLEMAVYNYKEKGGQNKFDEIADRFSRGALETRTFREKVDDDIKNFTDKVNKYLFTIDQKLIQISNYKK